ncbi:MAG: rhodanese-like domain-containing protein [Gammaproteobacteria bacterium]|nr:rhodanese-like domain-containing protein [Gammaproteobacteria bacterium]
MKAFLKAGIMALMVGLFSVTVTADPSEPSVPGKTLIIDVRTPGEYQQSHVNGAINIPYDLIATRISAVAPNHDEPIVLYCHSGRRAGIAENTLREMGYGHVANKGGIEDMRRAGYGAN